MPTPKEGYYTRDGIRRPGTTTIIGRFKNSGALIKWAYRQGREHEALARMGKPAPSDLYEVTSEAANIGTAAHQMVEMTVDGENPLDSSALASLANDDQRQRAIKSHGNYVRWADMSKVKVVAQEMKLVSEMYMYGGTPDAIGEFAGELCLLDWKTSNSVYSDYLIQLAAYKNLWEENYPDRPLTGGAHLLRFSKDAGDFAHHYFDDLSLGWELFKLYRQAYTLDQQLEKRL
jgi:hypothetical protein